MAEEQNPSSAPELPSRKRIPFSAPLRKLEVTPIPGYHLRWVKGTPQRLAHAQRSGYEFVSQEEIEMNNTTLGDDINAGGSRDLGSRVSIEEGSEVDSGGQAVRLYLMKQKQEYKDEDDAVIAQRNDSIAEALSASFQTGAPVGGPAQGEQVEDLRVRYVDPRRTKMPDLFRKKSR